MFMKKKKEADVSMLGQCVYRIFRNSPTNFERLLGILQKSFFANSFEVANESLHPVYYIHIYIFRAMCVYVYIYVQVLHYVYNT